MVMFTFCKLKSFTRVIHKICAKQSLAFLCTFYRIKSMFCLKCIKSLDQVLTKYMCFQMQRLYNHKNIVYLY